MCPQLENFINEATKVVPVVWPILTAAVAAGWVVITFIRDARKQAIERNGEIMSRLQESEKQIMDSPDIQKYLSQNAGQDEDYFRNQAVLGDDLFYKAKAHVYSQLNLFDEILSLPSRTSGSGSFLKPPALIERSDWETFIKAKLRHPLFRSILKHEKEIFGGALQCFWKKNSKEIESTPADPFVW